MRPWTAPPPGQRGAPPGRFNGATALRPWTAARLARRRLPDRASMGPRPCGRGRHATIRGRGGGAAASMGPRPCGRGRCSWRRPPRAPPRASMGPRPCGRGRRYTSVLIRFHHSFNGATALRPWTDDRQYGCGRRHVASMGPRPCGRGRRRPARDEHRPEHASMGPRPCGRGRYIPPMCGGAHEQLQWGHGLAAVDGRTPRPRSNATTCFNGATALRPWTAAAPCTCRSSAGLQWGHGLAAVDGTEPEPEPPTTWCFNGATALRPWTDRRQGADQARRPASMGPRPCGRGRAGMWRQTPGCWAASMGPRPCGRGRSNPARASASVWRGFNGATALRPWTAVRARPGILPDVASMGPRPCGRGRVRRAPRRRRGRRASMGPRPCGRGRLGFTARPCRAAALQWGHGLAAVDGDYKVLLARH